MIDIKFYQQFSNLRKELDAGKPFDRTYLETQLESFRSPDPIVYNIETTNACNMECQMCPRTTLMTRKIETLNQDTFIHIIDQLAPHSEQNWTQWKTFVKTEYGITENDMSENHFFLYIIPKVIQLHGYGDPLLDVHMDAYIKLLKERHFYSYFSCNPANINLNRTFKMMDNGLDYIKYSIESVDDDIHKKIRGNASNFKSSYEKILQVLDYKHAHQLTTTIVITMLNLNRTHQIKDYQLLCDAFKDLDVYIYLKSEDQQWYRKEYHPTHSFIGLKYASILG